MQKELKRQRQKGSGTIYKRGRLWWIQYFVNGKQKLESSGSEDRKEAEALLKIRAGEVASGKFTRETGRVRMAELFQDVLDDYILRELQSVDDVESRIRMYLKPKFGDCLAMQFSTTMVKRYIAERRGDGAANATINREMAIVRRAFSLGLTCDPPKVQKLIKLPKLKEDNVRSGFLERAQYILLRDALPEHVRLPLVIGYYLGQRRGEVVKLRWSQVDFANSEIKLQGRQTKNGDPRTAPIYGELRGWLEMARAHRDEFWPTCQWVCALHGKQLGSFRKTWITACKLAGVPDLLFHDLRRSAVRNMERAGISRHIAMAITGHKTESVYKRYDIINSRDLQNAGLRMEQYQLEQAEDATPARIQKVN